MFAGSGLPSGSAIAAATLRNGMATPPPPPPAASRSGLAGLGVDTALQAAPVLDAGIAAPDLELHLQIEVGEHFLVVQVVLAEIHEVLGHQRLVTVDRAVLDVPLPCLAVPAVESLAVKQLNEAGAVVVRRLPARRRATPTATTGATSRRASA